MTLFYAVLTLILGLTAGSFLNMLIYRLPRNISLFRPVHSICPRCKNSVKWYSNIPLLSYVIQKGKCRDCGGKISISYPVVELTTALVFCLIFFKSGATLVTVKYCFMSFMLLGAGFTDLFTKRDTENFECGVVPDFYTLCGVLAGYIWSLFTPTGFLESLAGSGAGFFLIMIPGYLYYVIRGQEGIGEGDALLLAMAGSFLGPRAVLFIFTFSAILGVMAGIVILAVTKNSRYMIPFAPMIAAAAIIYIFAGGTFARLTGI